MVFATKDINGVHQSLQNHGFPLGEPTDGEGIIRRSKTKKMEKFIFTPDLTEASFLCHRTH